ncbi:lanthionine synthetase C family protein [Longimycelium tulufanense]|uniref:lanthionine synthetase C family protein n=1 Tax=Longimycelium tulufanense TaxID=907463 RepID=UPI001E325DAC|nr:lanthionine synthetase C family protein [Longimycelium tulufanense]
MGTGAAGIVLLANEQAHAGIAGWDTVHQWAKVMTREPVTTHPDACGLFRGAPAVAFVLHTTGRIGYAAELEILDRHIATLVQQRLERAHARIDHGRLPSLREYDLISGLTGLGVSLLHRHGEHELLCDVLAYLVRLTEPVTVDGQTLPGWWADHGPDDQPNVDWPGGHGNLGLAHGVAGPLALLATAHRRGITVPGQVEAIDRICTSLEEWRCGPSSRPWWPGMISRREWQDRTVRQPGPQRPSWCYGTPGITRAQQLAARALGDIERQRRAENTLAACLTDEQQLAQLGDASLCHGWAGAIHTAWRAATDAGPGSRLAALLPNLRSRLGAYLNRHGLPGGSGLLDGASGVALVRHHLAVDTPPASGWDVCLLVAG